MSIFLLDEYKICDVCYGNHCVCMQLFKFSMNQCIYCMYKSCIYCVIKILKYMSCQRHLLFVSGKYLGRYQGFQLFYITNKTDFHPVSCKHVGVIVFFIDVLMFGWMVTNRQVLLYPFVVSMVVAKCLDNQN